MTCAACIEIRAFVGRDQWVIVPHGWVPKHVAGCPAKEPMILFGMKVWSYDPRLDGPSPAKPSAEPPAP